MSKRKEKAEEKKKLLNLLYTDFGGARFSPSFQPNEDDDEDEDEEDDEVGAEAGLLGISLGELLPPPPPLACFHPIFRLLARIPVGSKPEPPAAAPGGTPILPKPDKRSKNPS